MLTSCTLIVLNNRLMSCHNTRPSAIYFNLFSSIQTLSRVRPFETPWSAALQASLSFTISQSLFKLMPIELVMQPAISSSVIPFSCPQSFSASGSFPTVLGKGLFQRVLGKTLFQGLLFTSGGQRIGASALASVLPVDILDWFPLGLTDLISFLSKGLSTFSSTIINNNFWDKILRKGYTFFFFWKRLLNWIEILEARK